jgi:hypothetical protein
MEAIDDEGRAGREVATPTPLRSGLERFQRGFEKVLKRFGKVLERF